MTEEVLSLRFFYLCSVRELWFVSTVGVRLCFKMARTSGSSDSRFFGSGFGVLVWRCWFSVLLLKGEHGFVYLSVWYWLISSSVQLAPFTSVNPSVELLVVALSNYLLFGLLSKCLSFVTAWVRLFCFSELAFLSAFCFVFLRLLSVFWPFCFSHLF